MHLSELKPGEKAVILGFNDGRLQEKLMEMGCLPGTEIECTMIAPFGNPVAFKISGYMLSMRLEEADTINIEPFEL